MSETEKKNRIQKTILLDEQDLAIVAHIQSTQNLSFSAAVKLLIRRHQIKQYEADEKATLAKMLHLLGQLMILLKEVVFSSDENSILLLEEIRDLLIQIRNAIFTRLGRKP